MFVSMYVYKRVLKTNTLEPKWIGGNPTNYNYIIYNNEKLEWVDAPYIASPNGALYKLIVDDNGTLSATPITTT